jgi:hypothetical protein
LTTFVKAEENHVSSDAGGIGTRVDDVSVCNNCNDVHAIIKATTQIMKNALSEDEQQATHFNEIINQCVSEFVDTLKSEASGNRSQETRTKVTINDLLNATSVLGIGRNSELMKESCYEMKKTPGTQEELELAESRHGTKSIKLPVAERMQSSVEPTAIDTNMDCVVLVPTSIFGDSNANQKNIQDDMQMLQSENILLKAALNATIVRLTRKHDVVTKLSKSSIKPQYPDANLTIEMTRKRALDSVDVNANLQCNANALASNASTKKHELLQIAKSGFRSADTSDETKKELQHSHILPCVTVRHSRGNLFCSCTYSMYFPSIFV